MTTDLSSTVRLSVHALATGLASPATAWRIGVRPRVRDVAWDVEDGLSMLARRLQVWSARTHLSSTLKLTHPCMRCEHV